MTKAERERYGYLSRAADRWGIRSDDLDTLIRAERTLRRWYEGECGTGTNWATWAIERSPHDNRPYRVAHWYDGRTTETLMPDREAGAKRRIAAVLARYPEIQAYYQTDPRGCALYLYRPADLEAGPFAGTDIDACYSSVGLAVSL